MVSTHFDPHITSSVTSTRRAEFIAGVRAVLPLVAGAIPFGLIYGASAVEVGLSRGAALGMSLFVFAGSSQFVAVSLLREGAGILLIVMTTFIVNARHALYSASLAPYLKHLSQKWLFPLAFWLTDEAYAVTISRFESGVRQSPHRHWYMLGAELTMYVSWQLVTLLGILAGTFLADSNLGLEFAMSVTFIGLVVPLIRTRPMLVSAVVAGGVGLALDGLPNKIGLMIAAVAAIAAGYIAESALASARKSAPEAEEGA